MMVNWVMYPEDASISKKISAAREEASDYAASKKKMVYVFAKEDHIEYTDDAVYAHAECAYWMGLICVFDEKGGETTDYDW
jgi:hypothetical protein